MEKYGTSLYNKPIANLTYLLKARIENPYDFGSVLREFHSSNPHLEDELDNDEFKTVVALSGGVDSSASLIIAKMLGFNPLAVTVNPGDIILPRYFRENVENLTHKLGVKHRYLDVDLKEVIDGSLEGRFHPCGRCSKIIEETVFYSSEKIISPW